ncbi:MAG: methyltransferase domain-containing protein [Oscillospiraceae bacterium]|nr:methyltransferase domain-containing protein [Oscillospiraceae bacterium]
MIIPLCPVCGAPLSTERPAWKCENNHTFDVARQGYVNLLPVTQKHSLHPGDTAAMVASRRDFLNAGYYAPIADKLRELVAAYAPHAESVLDAGCGEGYYLSHLDLNERWGVDISKDAVRCAAVREKNAKFLAATAAHLPFADAAFDCVLSMFALTAAAEFARVLKDGGVFVQVLAGETHLSALKSVIYPTLLEKEKNLHPQLDGFTLLHGETLAFDFTLESQEAVQNLLSMTPHVWRISKEGADALKKVDRLSDRAEVIFNVYGRQKR